MIKKKTTGIEFKSIIPHISIILKEFWKLFHWSSFSTFLSSWTSLFMPQACLRSAIIPSSRPRYAEKKFCNVRKSMKENESEVIFVYYDWKIVLLWRRKMQLLKKFESKNDGKKSQHWYYEISTNSVYPTIYLIYIIDYFRMATNSGIIFSAYEKYFFVWHSSEYETSDNNQTPKRT